MENISIHSDAELVARIADSKKEPERAFAEIYDRYSKKVYAYIIKIVNNKEQAEDIFQETFVRFYQNIQYNYKGGSVIGFIITIARNLCLNYKRDKKINVPFEEAIVNFSSMPADDSDNEHKELVTAALELLDVEYREPLVLRVYEGMRYEEIAEITGTTVGNARLKVHRAKDKLRAILTPYLNEFIG